MDRKTEDALDSLEKAALELRVSHDRYKDALWEVLILLRKTPYTVSGTKARIRDICEHALDLERKD